jgi:hypothetical protein
MMELSPLLMMALTGEVPEGFSLLDEGDIMMVLFEAEKLGLDVESGTLARVSKPLAIEKLLKLGLISLEGGYVKPKISEAEWERIKRV